MKKAVLGIVTDSSNKEVLFLHRHLTDHTNPRWCLPGGKVDEGETNIEALVRELKEKTNLDVKVAYSCFHYVSHFFNRDTFLIEVFEVEVFDITQLCVDSGEFSGTLYLPIKFCLKNSQLNLAGNTAEILRLYDRHF